MIRGRLLAAGVLAAALALAACDVELLGPDDRPLAVERLRLSVSSSGQVLKVLGGATRPSTEDGGEARVDLATSAGDREPVTVDRNVCRTAGGERYVCDEFNFGMEDGVELDSDIRSRIRTELDARILRLFSFEAASVKLFSGDLEDVVAEVRQWPGVEYAEPNGFMDLYGSENGSFSDTVLVSVTGALPVEDASATPKDGVLQVSPGDTVLATHRSRDGEEVTARIAGWPGGDGS